MKIVCIGEALIDMICTDKGRPLSEGEHFLKKPGGAPTNVAAAIAALGGEVMLAAKVGHDPFGQHLMDVMTGFGVSVRWVIRDDQAFTTLAFVSLMENGERDFVFNLGADGLLRSAEISGLDLDRCAVVHFGSATAFLSGPLQSTYTDLLHKARDRGLFVSFDPNYRHLLFKDHTASFIRQSWNFIEQCDFFKVSDEEALLLTGKSSVEDAVADFTRRAPATFAITLGQPGTLLVHRGEPVKIPSIPVKPVDTTGAGDAFVGAVLFQLAQHEPAAIRGLSLQEWQQIVSNGNKAGARTCEYVGAMEAFRHLSKQIFE